MRDEFFWLGQMNKATVVTNTRLGLLSTDLAKKAAVGIQTVLDSGVDPENRVKRVIQFEPKLIAAAGPEVTVIHVGRSSQDMHSTYRSAMMRDHVLRLADSLTTVMTRLIELGQEHKDTILPSYTNGVAAQPTSFAHYLLGFLEGFKRDHERLVEFYDRLNVCPMGACVLNGTGWPLNRDDMAKLLGFDRPRLNAFDCTCETPVDFALEVSSVAASVGVHVGSMINDIMVQYAQSRPWIILQEGGENTYVSSAMPQKRNPGLMNNCRGDASDVVSEMTAVFTRVHNLVPGMVDGKSVAKNGRMTKSAVSMLERFLKVLNALRINPARALEELNSDWTASQEIADRLMHDHGLPFRIGHHVASRMVSWARANNVLPQDFPYEQMQRIYVEEIREEFPEGPEVLPMSKEEFLEALDPRKIIANRKTKGSAAPAEVEAMLADFAAALKAEQGKTNAMRQQVTDAIAGLEAAFAEHL